MSASWAGHHAGGGRAAQDDLKFTVVLSDDDFQKDLRQINAPCVTFEETPRMVAGHFILTRYSTWRIDLNAKAKQIKIMPRVTTKDCAALVLTDIEIYGSNRVDQLAARAMTADIDGDGVTEVLFARQDGFINVFRLDDGFNLARISVGAPIIGMTVLTGQDGKPRIVAGTRFGVQVFGTDLKKIGGVSLPAQAATFAGPGGKDEDRVYVVGPDGSVSVLVLADRGTASFPNWIGPRARSQCRVVTERATTN